MRDLLITAIVFGTVPFVFRRPWVGILLLSWLGYMNPHRQAWGFAYDFPFSMVVAVVTILAFLFSRDKEMLWLWTRETIVLLAFLAWMLFTTFFAFYPEAAWANLIGVFKVQIIILLTALLIKNRQQLHWLIWVIVLSIGFYGAKGGIFTIATGGNYRVWGPAESFFADNNEMALTLVMLLPLMRYLQLYARQRWIGMGLGLAMLLCAVAAIGSQSRGGLLAILAMGFTLWLKSRRRLSLALYFGVAIAAVVMVMPQSWYDRMHTIQTYEEDSSALGRINAWHTAFNVARVHVTGGGFQMFQRGVFEKYAPDPLFVADAHSNYFEVMGEHGFVGLALFLLLGLFAWMRATAVVAKCKDDPEKKWAADLAAMLQVSMVGYAVGGAFLGLAYFDLPYHLMVMVLLAAKFAGVLKTASSPAAVSFG